MKYWIRKSIDSHHLLWIASDIRGPRVEFYMIRPKAIQEKVKFGEKIEILE